MMTSASELDELVHHSPLHIATELDSLDFVKYLIGKRANPLDRVLTMVHLAAMKGRLEILKYLVEHVGCNPATGGGDECNVVHIAAIHRQTEVVKYLVEQCQVDPSNLDAFKNVPLKYSCMNGDLETASFLIDNMKDMSMDDIFYRDDSTRFDAIQSPLCCACYSGCLPLVKYLIEKCECDPTRPEGGYEHKTPLIVAIKANHLEIVKYLSRFKVPCPTRIDPLHHAVNNQNLAMVKYLIKSFHCDPNRLSPISLSSTRLVAPLHIAAQVGDLSIVKYLLSQKCDPGIMSYAIHFAAYNGHLAVLKYLIEVKNCNPSATDENGISLLYLAADAGHLDVFQYLCSRHGCDPLRAACNFLTPLHQAASKGHLDIVRFTVLVLKCDPNIKGERGNTPLHYAAFAGHLETVKFLLEEARCDPYDIDAVLDSVAGGNFHILKYLLHVSRIYKDFHNPRSGFSLLSMAATKGHLNLIGCRTSHFNPFIQSPLHTAAGAGQLEIVKYLLNRCPNMYYSDCYSSPFFSAAAGGHMNVIKYFLEEQFDPNTFLCGGNLPIHGAAAYGHMAILKYLVEEIKCDVNSINQDKTTPLSWAAYLGQLDVIRYLVTKGADLSSRDVSGNSPLHLAALVNQLEVVKFLAATVNPSLILNDKMETPLDFALEYNCWITALYLIVKTFNCLCDD